MKASEWIKNERETRNLSRVEFARICAISPSQVDLYENGTYTPAKETELQIADRLGKYDDGELALDSAIGKKLRRKRNEVGMTQIELSRRTRIPTHIISDYELCKKEMSDKHKEVLFNAFSTNSTPTYDSVKLSQEELENGRIRITIEIEGEHNCLTFKQAVRILERLNEDTG